MPVELRWLASRAASSFHVAAALADGTVPAQPEVAAEFCEPAARLSLAIASLDVPRTVFFNWLVPLAASLDGNRMLAEVVLAKVCGAATAKAMADQFAALFADLKQAQATAQPKLLDELELRAGPLREQWEGRGPGLLAGIGRLTEPGILVERADVLVVFPVAGGAGSAHAAHNAASIEGVLANPLPQLPEVARLAWLIAQLNLDLPRYAETLHDPRRVVALAMIPPTLAAASNVELLCDDAATLRLALRAWRPGGMDESAMVDRLECWWKTWSDNRSNWPVALAALEQMLTAGQT